MNNLSLGLSQAKAPDEFFLEMQTKSDLPIYTTTEN
jgi:hypothetical protein